ncbi:MAG: Xaa-Pro aminopeptidase [Gaiellaceae bacterium]|nr:Xaa-Pro aminopeptidase [Gaiellaceae bacterium]MDX6474111.1 Xaa-Pro aminopeptidase [Gaiellaceae bacterium]
MNARIERLRALIEEPLLVTNPKNVVYLAGFESSNAALLVDQERVQLFTDFRYIEAARAVEGVEVVQTKRGVIGALAERLSGPIGFEATNVVYADYLTLEEGGLELRPHNALVESLRAIKDESELQILRRACAITDRVFERLTEVKFVGRTEREVSWDLTRLFHEEGGEGLAFESIVGAGPTGARPHARAGDRVIGTGELVVIDAGCTVDGYASDYTRTFATGPLDDEAKDVYATVLAAQLAGLEAIRADIAAIDADGAARRVIEESPYAGTFGHGLGHGLGLDVHELPRMTAETEDVLAPGNVVTVEPGIYLEGKFGVRIEDDVVVTPDGIENLTGFRKDLIEVG